MGKTISIDGLADAVMEELTEYNKLAEETMKKAVTKAGQTVRKEIKAGAPVKTGRYAKSWTTKKTKESSTRLEVTVYSPSRYMLAHLLEHGQAKRNGRSTRAYPHIAPAEEIGEKQLEADIIRGLSNG